MQSRGGYDSSLTFRERYCSREANYAMAAEKTMTRPQPSKHSISLWIALGCGALVIIAILCVCGFLAVGWFTSTPEVPAPQAGLPTDIPTEAPPPAPTDTPPLPQTPTAPPFEEIRSQMKDMTEAQRNEYIRSLKGLRISNWAGWVHDVYEESSGGYKLYVTLNPPPGDILNAYDVTLDITDDIALQLKKDQPITFSGQIDSVNEVAGVLISIHLVDAAVETEPVQTSVTLATATPALQKTYTPTPSRTPPATQRSVTRIGDTIPEVGLAKEDLSMTLIGWAESDIAVDGPYVGNEFYTFTARPGMKFIILEFEFHNNWAREQETPYFDKGEVRTDKGYFYQVWSPPGGIHSEEYAPRASTQEEVENLGGSGAFKDLLPEESVRGHVVFEIPEDEEPEEVELSQVPVPIKLD